MVKDNVKKPYVDFAYYKDEYGGVYIKTEKDFRRTEKFAEAFVDRVTFGRIQRLLTITDLIRDTICCATDLVAIQNEKKGTSVKSESNDGYSISYADAESDTVLHAEMYNTVRTYLANTGLLSRRWVKEYDDKQ